MKALIVIEIPEDHFLITANDLYDRLKGYKCDLKPMPERKEIDKTLKFGGYENTIQEALARGYNACLEEIEK